MKPYTRTIFILILIVPLALLAWLGQRSLMQDRIVSEHQSIELAKSRLREPQTLIHSFNNELQQSAVTALSLLQIKGTVGSEHISLIREVINTDPYLEQVFILGSEREILFPQDTGAHSNAERRFSEELLTILQDENAFRTKPFKETGDVPLSEYNAKNSGNSLFPDFSRTSRLNQTIATLSGVQQDSAAPIETGWTTWDAGTSTDIFLWHRTADQVLIGQKLSYSYWLSQLIAQLPSSVSNNVTTTDVSPASIRLIDKRQRSIYQWGNHTIEDSNGRLPVSKEWLSYPLDGWRLEYFAPPQSTTNTQVLMFGLTFMSLLALIGLGGRLIWQEYRREMRNAEQRVSFVNQVSHELKTPLTNICIYAEMLEAEVMQDDQPDRKRVKKFTDVVTSESQRLGRLINNVLNFSRSQQQKLSAHRSQAIVDAIVKQTLNNYSASLTAKDIAIETQLDAATQVMLDAEILEQVLNNLLSNVEKYAADGGMVCVSSAIKDRNVVIWVRDAGAGVPPALREKIFEPFERGSESLTEAVSGTGIGLSIARDLCRLHGGDLTLIDSERGACFQVTLNTEVEQ